MSATDLPDTPDVDVLTRVRDALRALPEQTRRRPGQAAAAVDDGPSVPLPRRRAGR